LVGVVDGKITRTPLETAVCAPKPLPPELLALDPLLSR
jgi:hypothetical protein